MNNLINIYPHILHIKATLFINLVSTSWHYVEIWTGAANAMASSRTRPSACLAPDRYIIVAA